MSNPSPLIPQGTFQAQGNKGASNVRIAVATIVAIHVVFFGGLLLQGCKPTKTAGNNTTETTPSSSTTSSNLSLPPITSESLYYSNATQVPTEPPPGTPIANTQPLSTAAQNTLAPSATNATRDPWKPSNLGMNGNAAPHEAAGTGATKEYTVARGDTFAKIAKANGTTVAAIKKANPTVDPSKLKAGVKLQVPTATVASASTTPPAATGGTDAIGSAPSTDSYTVRSGDTLTKVAKAHNVSVSQLRAANNLKTSGLKAGQKLKIPAPSAATSTNDTATPTVKHSTKSSKSSTNTTHTAAH
jgi:LysM repeat protein